MLGKILGAKKILANMYGALKEFVQNLYFKSKLGKDHHNE